jgi:D-lactate dehydrogenase (cytochrome)
MNSPHPDPAALRRPFPAVLAASLAALLGERFSTSRALLEQHGRDESALPPAAPDAVVFPESTAEVAAVVKACAAHGVAMIPWGNGSSLEGHLLAIHGGVAVDLTRMKRIVSIDAEDLLATVEAGVSRKELNEALKTTGLFFPIDPGADATLAGMAATRASGTNAVRYGTMRENTLALTVVLADGRVVRTGTRARKSSAGYDLTRLFVGSEGTLGIITEVTVRLFAQPEAISAAVCQFPSVKAAVDTVILTIQHGVPVARIEFLDSLMVRAVNAYSKLSLREAPMLFLEFHGSAASVQEQAQAAQEIAREHGGMDFEWTANPEERSRLWAARHSAYFAMLQLRPGSRSSTTDTCVPISRLAECLVETVDECAASGLLCPIVGHVGDGNFHVGILVDPNAPEEVERAEELNRSIVERALRLGGTCTGEHGVGLHKRGFLLEEAGADAVGLMRAIKLAFDPANLMNPGKVFRFEAT